ncbi:hypothetical protein [Polyangium sp. 15x6]|uniref:hypothetical protein n=1 Tax=Polyangium sp. 15x6 TaxID=3042687 RepID=UPI00249C6C01|nr:hypothetical protein [Polyangium sp. 15x6]MDI3289002.1 hypothetical protein [Polyangium sp. 15x6]
MNERRDRCRADPTRLGLLLLAVVAFANGCAVGDVAGQPGDPSSDEVTEDLQSREVRHVYTCTLAQGLVIGSLEVVSEPGAIPTCRMAASEPRDSSRIFCFPAPPLLGTCPDCVDLKDTLGCVMAP